MSDVKRSGERGRFGMAFLRCRAHASPSVGTRSARSARPDAGDRESKCRMATAAKKPVKHGYFGPAKNEAHRALAQAASWERSRTEMKMFFGNNQTLPHGEQDGTRRSLVWPRVPAVRSTIEAARASDPAGPDAAPSTGQLAKPVCR